MILQVRILKGLRGDFSELRIVKDLGASADAPAMVSRLATDKACWEAPQEAGQTLQFILARAAREVKRNSRCGAFFFEYFGLPGRQAGLTAETQRAQTTAIGQRRDSSTSAGAARCDPRLRSE